MFYFICDFQKQRTPSEYIGYGLYFYFSGLSLRRAAGRLSDCFIKRNPVSIWNWIQKYKPSENNLKEKENLRICNR
jgi:putative transposase